MASTILQLRTRDVLTYAVAIGCGSSIWQQWQRVLEHALDDVLLVTEGDEQPLGNMVVVAVVESGVLVAAAFAIMRCNQRCGRRDAG